MKFSVNDVTLNVVVEGDERAPAVLLLHGFPDSSILWSGQMKPLLDAGYRVIVPDLRGFGDSDAPAATSAYAMKNSVDDMIALMDQLKIDKFKLVGHDFGAALAWSLAISLPERVERLVVVSVGHLGKLSGSDVAKFGEQGIMLLVAHAAGSYFSAGGVDQKKASWYMLLFVQEGKAEQLLQADDWRLFKAITSPGVPEAAHKAYIADLSRPGRLTAGLNWYRAGHSVEAFVSLDANPDVPGVQMPTMGIWPTGDHYCLETQMLASEDKVPKGCWRYEKLQSASHWAPRDEPERVASLLLDFFKQDFPGF